MAKRKRSNSKNSSRSNASAGAASHTTQVDAASSQPTVASLRHELDALDREILAAINRRGQIAQQIGQAKQADKTHIYDATRESQVLEQAVANNTGPLADDAVRAIFREIVSGTRALQTPVRAAYLGPEFTFSHLAAIERFGQSAELVPVSTIAAVFEEVERGQVDFGVVPMENSTDGRVSDTLDCFSRSRARICGELQLRIHHCLLGEGTRDAVRIVYSKSQPLSQCRNWLAKHLPNATITEQGSTAGAVKQAKGQPHAAAIASHQAATHYGLPVLVPNIEDNPDNVTRFAIISTSTTSKSTARDKTALMLEIAHQPGALADAMAVFKKARLNMTWIESFPIPGHRGSYLFFIEFVGHHADREAKRAIATLAKKSHRVVVLGSYAATEPVG
jgi:chorismate mutase/prephenate dehydratase